MNVIRAYCFACRNIQDHLVLKIKPYRAYGAPAPMAAQAETSCVVCGRPEERVVRKPEESVA